MQELLKAVSAVQTTTTAQNRMGTYQCLKNFYITRISRLQRIWNYKKYDATELDDDFKGIGKKPKSCQYK